MNNEQEAKYTTWGLIAGVGCVALFLFYAVSSGAMQSGSGGRACRTCQPSVSTLPAFSSPISSQSKK